MAMERASVTRLRWRLRGAWMWPAYLGLTVVEVQFAEQPLAQPDVALVGDLARSQAREAFRQCDGLAREGDRLRPTAGRRQQSG